MVMMWAFQGFKHVVSFLFPPVLLPSFSRGIQVAIGIDY
jgi:hypothetical protein